MADDWESIARHLVWCIITVISIWILVRLVFGEKIKKEIFKAIPKEKSTRMGIISFLGITWLVSLLIKVGQFNKFVATFSPESIKIEQEVAPHVFIYEYYNYLVTLTWATVVMVVANLSYIAIILVKGVKRRRYLRQDYY